MTNSPYNAEAIEALVQPRVQRGEAGQLSSSEQPAQIAAFCGNVGAEAVIYAVNVAAAGIDLMRPGLAPYARLRPP